MSCDLLLDFVTERFYVVVVVGGVGNFKCTKAHHRGQQQDTLIQPTRFCPQGVCLFKISSQGMLFNKKWAKKICVWHKLSCDLIGLSVVLRPTYVDLFPPLPSATNSVKDFWQSPFVGSFCILVCLHLSYCRQSNIVSVECQKLDSLHK